MAIYFTLDHSKSFQGQAPWVQASPLKETSLPAPGKHTATIILLHGFANSGTAWEPIAKHLQTSLPHVKFILPNASIIKVHVLIAGAPGETQLPAIQSSWAGKDTPVNDVEGFKKATANLEKIIEEEAKLVAPGRVILRALWRKSVGTTDPSTLKKAIFWAHGKADYLPINWATQSIDYLVNPVGFKKISKNEAPTAGTITWSSYEELKHETNEEELEDIQKW
ncbi:hypothetical protein NA56DRAFT_697177 [Hyaloscypha hepaticicola]|uniref:Acyl-protein thioesterase 1 n=1 Tax=Hyaloscypha hepaticicola TaxID=2082293 RepID=A0A2J6QL83_9HELO|nr:hypothetical protein NA56DRAFT_697177 [Hyaloscypha hepaticicola]